MHPMRLLIIILVLISIPCRAANPPESQQFVLFVGNSLTYVGNTPAVFDALAAANGKSAESDMIVQGGATLAQRVNDGSVARALETKRYDAVVLQERGGDLLCSFGPASCLESRKAIKSLASLAADSGTKAYLLGSYQGNPSASQALVSAESAAAVEAGIPYLEVSEKLQVLRSTPQEFAWTDPDGMHPGPGIALLNAAVLYQALAGTAPVPSTFTVNAPIYEATSGLTEFVRGAADPPPLTTTPVSVTYPEELVHIVVDALLVPVGG